MSKNWRRGVLALVCLALLGGGLWLHSWHKHLFTPERWQAEPENRQYMLEDLQTKHELVGMSRDAVLALLGEADMPNEPGAEYSFKGDQTRYGAENTLVYYIGSDPVWRMNAQWLVLPLVEGKVAAVKFGLT